MIMKPSQVVFQLRYHSLALFILTLFGISATVELVAEDEWPMWRRNTQGGPIAGEPKLQDPQITEQTRLWVSEADIPPGRRGSGDDGRGQDGLQDMDRPAAGGFGSPIAAAGKIFQYHYRPSGTLYDAVRARGLKMNQEELLAQRPALEGNLVRGHERWLVSATDVMTAIDAETGKTVWQTDFNEEGINFAFFGKGGGGMTPVYHDGMVVSLSSTMEVFGLDAETGAVRWAYRDLPRAIQQREYRREAIEETQQGPRFNRDMLVGLVAADGLVIVNDQRLHRVKRRSGTTYNYDEHNSYVALDVRTGEKRWEAPGVGSGGSTPKLVNIDGKTYVLAIGLFHLTLLDLETGATIWQSSEGHDSPTCAFNLAVSDNYVIMSARAEGVSGRRFTGYSIDLNGLHELWTWGPIREYRSNALIVDDRAYMVVDGHLRCFNPANGEIHTQVPIGDVRPAGGSPFIAYYGGWIFTKGRRENPEGGHDNGFWVMNAEPDQMASTQRFFDVDTAQPYFVIIFPAFANGRIFFRTDMSYKMEAYQLE